MVLLSRENEFGEFGEDRLVWRWCASIKTSRCRELLRLLLPRWQIGSAQRNNPTM